VHGVFKELRGLVNIKCDVIVSDFEAALWRATREIFPGAVHRGIKKDHKVCRRNVCRRNVRIPLHFNVLAGGDPLRISPK